MLRIALGCLLLLVLGCAHEPAVTAAAPTEKGLKIWADEFFKLSAQDITTLNKAMRNEGKLAVLQVSDGRNAVCKPGSCTLVQERNKKLEIPREALAPIVSALESAQMLKKEILRPDGSVTLRCRPTGCAYDLYVIDPERKLRTNPKVAAVSEDDFFLSGVVQSLIQDATSTPASE
jgi:hypothetical protein